MRGDVWLTRDLTLLPPARQVKKEILKRDYQVRGTGKKPTKKPGAVISPGEPDSKPSAVPVGNGHDTMMRQQHSPKKENDAGTPEPSHLVAGEPEVMDLPSLVRRIADIHYHLVERATKAVNVSLTLRNWLIGLCLQNYELEGKDRATYGDRLFSTLSQDLTSRGVSNCSPRQLYRYRDFYLAYPHIVGTLYPQLQHLLSKNGGGQEIAGTLTHKSGMVHRIFFRACPTVIFRNLSRLKIPEAIFL